MDKVNTSLGLMASDHSLREHSTVDIRNTSREGENVSSRDDFLDSNLAFVESESKCKISSTVSMSVNVRMYVFVNWLANHCVRLLRIL